METELISQGIFGRFCGKSKLDIISFVSKDIWHDLLELYDPLEVLNKMIPWYKQELKTHTLHTYNQKIAWVSHS